MAHRTFAIGDIHGDTEHLFRLMSCLPRLDANDTLVFMGDYVDRGARSAQVVQYMRVLPSMTPARVVALRGNHEDAWVRVLQSGWDEFVLPPTNGCLAAYRSYVGGPIPDEEEVPQPHEQPLVRRGLFFPPEDVEWFNSLPYWYEDEHAIYVHAGLPRGPEGFLHPSNVPNPITLLWCREEDFYLNYRGKRVVFGHTRTEYLPAGVSHYAPDDPEALWAGVDVVGIDTGCGNGGFLTALELPAMRVYESR